MNRQNANVVKTMTRFKQLLKKFKIPQSVAAKELRLDPDFFTNIQKINRISENKILKSLNRLEAVLLCAKNNLGLKGGGAWLLDSNPFLAGQAPISCIGTDKDADRVCDLLESIGLGLPA